MSNSILHSITTFFFLLLITFSSSVSAACNAEDMAVLLKIKSSFPNAAFFNSWNPSTDCCTTWDGVNCDSFGSGRVTGLGIAYDETLSGTIPPAVGDLKMLKSLSFGILPGLVGPLPPELSKLVHLEYFQLTNTSLSGPLPEYLGNFRNMSVLIFEINLFSGPIPENIGNSPNLISLALKNSKLTGCIPHKLFQNSQFKINVALDLSGNHLLGYIPESLSDIDWVDINLSDNRLTGGASFLFGENKFARIINLSNNKLNFDFSPLKIPKQLSSLNLSHNKIIGRIPAQIIEVNDLQTLDLSYNKLCGKIPTGGPMSRFTAESYGNNKCLCGAPLPPCE